MNRTLTLLFALALAGSAWAQDEAKNEPKRPPALNLRLDDSTSAAPRITFEQPHSAQSKAEREKGLPELGGKPSRSFDRQMSPGASPSGSVIPKAMNPSLPADQQ